MYLMFYKTYNLLVRHSWFYHFIFLVMFMFGSKIKKYHLSV